jgi:hypothetical protein
MKNDKWAKKTTAWWPREGSRARGRPKRRWKDTTDDKMGTRSESLEGDVEDTRQQWRDRLE